MTGQNRGLSGLKHIWPVIMTGNLLSVIFSPVQHIKQTEQGALHLFLTYQSMSNIINEPINVSVNDEQTVSSFYETMTEHRSNQIKNIMQAQIETSASALGS